jgi:DNA-binding transcriptional LysR family regulator
MLVVEIDDIRAFLAVVDSGSISRAANELYLTQPAVTRRVQRLESAVGSALLDRRQRPFALTDAGRAAVACCRQLLASVQELRAVAADDGLPSGEIRLGVAHALTEFALSVPVERLRRSFPRVVFRLRTGWSREILERVRGGTLDGAVILLPVGEQLPAGVVGEALGQERLVVVAARRAQGTRTRRLADLGRSGWVLNPEGCNARASLQRAFARAGMGLHVDVEAYSYELQLSLVARNHGLGLVPARILARSRMRSRLRTLRTPDLSLVFRIWSVRAETSERVERVLKELNEELRKRLRPSR